MFPSRGVQDFAASTATDSGGIICRLVQYNEVLDSWFL